VITKVRAARSLSGNHAGTDRRNGGAGCPEEGTLGRSDPPRKHFAAPAASRRLAGRTGELEAFFGVETRKAVPKCKTGIRENAESSP